MLAVLNPEDEVIAVTMIAERLEASFPDVPAVVVQHVVNRSYEQFDGRPIRDFVPVLVERMARNDLRGRLTTILQVMA